MGLWGKLGAIEPLWLVDDVGVSDLDNATDSRNAGGHEGPNTVAQIGSVLEIIALAEEGANADEAIAAGQVEVGDSRWSVGGELISADV